MPSIPFSRRAPWRRPIAVAMGATLVALAAGCGSDSADEGGAGGGSADAPFALRVTVVPGVGSLPFRVAMEQGFFEENGLDVEVTEGFEINNYLAALDSQFDAVMVVPTFTVQAVAAGLDLKAYAGMEALAEDILTNPIITNDPAINSLEDLAEQGGTLGELIVSDETAAVLNYALEGSGVDASNIEEVPVPFTDQIDQLRAGRIDAAVSAVGFFEPLLDQGYRVIAEFPDDYLVKAGAELPLAFPHFVSSAAFVEDNPDIVQAFTDSIREGVAWIDANPEDGLKMFAEWVGRDPATVTDITMPAWKVEVSAADFEPWQEVLESGGIVEESSFDASSVVVEGLK